jgi:membrane protease subunit HflK
MGESGFPRMPDIQFPKINARIILMIIAGILVLVGVFTSFYTVGPDEVAVIQRFGAYIGTADHGLHFKIPFFIDNVTNVKTTFVYKQEFGFRTVKADVESEFVTEKPELEPERLSLTGDLNVVALEWAMQYTVKDPYNYLFKVRNMESTIRSVSEAAIKEVIGDYTIDEIITTERENIASKAMFKTQEILDSYESGIDVAAVNLINVNPPTKEVQDAFEAVNRAEQQRDELIKRAEKEYFDTIPVERGRKQQMIDRAEGQKQALINVATGETSQFNKVLEQYRLYTDKNVEKRRLYLEAWYEILPKLGRKIIVDGDLRGLIQLLNLQETLNRGGSQ